MIRTLYGLFRNLLRVLFRLLVKEPLKFLVFVPLGLLLRLTVGLLFSSGLVLMWYTIHLIWYVIDGRISALHDAKLLLETFFLIFNKDTYTGGVTGLLILLGMVGGFTSITDSLLSTPPQAYIKKLASGIFRTHPSSLFSFATQNKWQSIVIHNPFQGIYIEGSAGSGKSQSVIEPIIHQAVSQGYSGFLYDFKGNPPTLSSCLHGAISRSKVRTQFAHINLSSPAISHRCNPLSPSYFPHKYYAHEYASVILKNLNKEWASKTDFWAENAIAYLAAILWYLRKYHPKSCSLPHATLLAMETPENSLALLKSDEETKRMVSAISTAYDNNAEKQIAGIFSSLQLSMSKLYTREIFWILSSNPGDVGHVTLDVSDSTHRQLLSVANDPILSDVFSPIVALIAMVCIKNMNQ